jgi:hypothetical protein
MDLKLILSVVLVGILIYFRFGPGVRRLKRKSHHYIEPPDPESDPNWVPLEIKDYQKYIFSHRSSSEDAIDDVYEAIKDEFPSMQFKVSIQKDWFLICVKHARFIDFHQAIAFCSYIEENVLGYGRHLNNSSKDYIVKIDHESSLDHLIGAFRSGENFGIYLPKSKLHPKGNSSRSDVTEIRFEQEFNKIKDLIS